MNILKTKASLKRHVTQLNDKSRNTIENRDEILKITENFYKDQQVAKGNIQLIVTE